MKHLWDTHALIWGMEDGAELSERAREIAHQGHNAISCISLWEIACLCHRGKLRLKLGVEEWLEAAAERLHVLPITPRIAVRAYDLMDFQGDPADRIIAATSLEFGLKLVTRDEKLRRHRGLDCVWD